MTFVTLIANKKYNYRVVNDICDSIKCIKFLNVFFYLCHFTIFFNFAKLIKKNSKVEFLADKAPFHSSETVVSRSPSVFYSSNGTVPDYLNNKRVHLEKLAQSISFLVTQCNYYHKKASTTKACIIESQAKQTN